MPKETKTADLEETVLSLAFTTEALVRMARKAFRNPSDAIGSLMTAAIIIAAQHSEATEDEKLVAAFREMLARARSKGSL